MRISEPDPGSPMLRQVKDLHDRHRQVLGLFPYGVFDVRAEQGNVLAASAGDRLLGYALYEIAKNRVRLVHLCIDPAARGRGIAGRLVDHLSAKHKDLPGIRVRCRIDYDADHLWPKLGFHITNEVLGRGTPPARLHVWWRPHQVEDLFSDLDDDDRLLAVLDHNVFLDLQDHTRDGAAESQVLDADWVSERLRLAVTPESGLETGRLADAAKRAAQLRAADGYERVISSGEQIQRTRAGLAERLGGDGVLTASDFNHVAYAAAADADLFVTRDEDLINLVAGPVLAATGLRILRPSDVVAHLDELAEAARYQPVSLQGSGFAVQDTGSGTGASLQHLLSSGTGERRKDFNGVLRRCVATPGVRCEHVTDPTGHIIAAWAWRADPAASTLVVEYLRTTTDVTGSTVLKHLFLDLRARAVRLGCHQVRIADADLPARLRAAAHRDGYAETPTGLLAYALPVTSSEQALGLLPEDSTWAAQLQNRETLTPSRVSELESKLWPAKLLNLPLASYLISIRPGYATELFSLTESLLERPELLALSREHVYYRSPRNSPRAPARVLWYASGAGKRGGIGAVVAVSRLVGIIHGTPVQLHTRFAHYGVWTLGQIATAATNGAASALLIADTERLDRPVGHDRLEQLAHRADRRLGPLLSPTAVPASFYEAVYTEGSARG